MRSHSQLKWIGIYINAVNISPKNMFQKEKNAMNIQLRIFNLKMTVYTVGDRRSRKG